MQILVKIKLKLPLKKRPLKLMLKMLLKRRLPRANCQRRRKSLLKPRRLLPMPPLKQMRDFLQNSPQHLLRDVTTTSESEMDRTVKIQSSVISFLPE